VKNYASAEQIIIFRAGEVSIRHFIGMPLILAERTGMNLQNEETGKKFFFMKLFLLLFYLNK
jgi:hypothetical protein